MCSRGGVGVARGSSGLQPMKATVLFQLNNSSKVQTTLRDAKPAAAPEKQLWCSLTGQTPQSQSLDAIVGPYLHGHWPKDAAHYKDKSTQTPASWADHQQSGPAGGLHKRSASWGSAAHKEVSRQRQQQCAVVLGGSLDRRRTHALTQAGPGSFSSPLPQSQPVPIPLSAVHTRLRHSEEKLEQELETIFKHHTLLQIPDFLVPNGRRGPVPPYSNCSSGSDRHSGVSSGSSPSTSACSSLSPGPSHPPSASPSPSPVTFTLETDGGVCGGDGPRSAPGLGSVVGEDTGSLSQPPSSSPLLPSSPYPNKSVCFQREPPEGCEKVPVCEEVLSSVVTQAHIIPSCPDPDRVNFTPGTNSTFCPVTQHKPLPPTVDFLFRNLSLSPGSEWAGQMGNGYAHT
ncbi:hypothetical protein ACEWY4_026394 [Coilia grayii]|uniref:Uncharacterized protein n=1 Tax=Coilia grayii TaxID=363190 RepID=A0ABD1IV26_9TELE